TLGPGQSVAINVKFAPTATGPNGGSLLIQGDAALNIPISGTGTTTTANGQLRISPASINFGTVDLGSSTTEKPTLTATGGSVTISSAASSNAQFAVVGMSFPVTINAGSSMALNLTFTPKGAGNASATLSFQSNATNSSLLEAVSGTGLAPYVTLSWSQNVPAVSGYNIYRGTAPGSYSKINATLDS